MADQNDGAIIVVGRITGLYGVKGWVKVFSETRPRENIVSYRNWLLGTPDQQSEIVVLDGRRQGKAVVAQIQGYDDRDQASALIGKDISLYRSQLAKPADDEFYWIDLVGCRVFNADGSELGQVDYLIETGANDVLVVKGQREILIPFIGEPVIKNIDLEARCIRVDWIEPD